MVWISRWNRYELKEYNYMLATKMRMSRAPFYPYKTKQSCRFNDDDLSELIRTPSVTGNQKIWTWSGWVKRCNQTTDPNLFSAGTDDNNRSIISFSENPTTQAGLMFYSRIASVNNGYIRSYNLIRDIFGWYHFVVALDAANTDLKMYANGVEVSYNQTYAIVNTNHLINGTDEHAIGNSASGMTARYFDGYLGEINFIDGQQLTPNSFGKFKNGIWIPKKYTGSYGTNGFYLDFADSSDFGNDISGNGNDFTSSGLSSNDQVDDSPTNNWCVLNINERLQYVSVSNGNLYASIADQNARSIRGTFNMTYGKWYWEYRCDGSGTENQWVGIASADCTLIGNPDADCYYYQTNGNKYKDGAGATAYGDSWNNGNLIGCAFDADSGKIYFSVDGVWQNSGDPVAGNGFAYENIDMTIDWASLWGGLGNAGENQYGLHNFGQLGFTYTPPTGYKALNFKNLHIPTIKDSSTGFDVITYEGNATARNITDLNFDISAGGLVCIKNRDQNDEHKWIDTVRGATNELSSDSVALSATDTNGLTAFLSNGFSLGTGADGYNDNNENFVAWCFRMGNKYGFDIQSYVGTGVAHAENHNLDGIPELMIVKVLNSDVPVYAWAVYHHHAFNKIDPETDYGQLNTVNIWYDTDTIWNDTKPTSTQFTIGTHNTVNENGKNFITYLWRSIPQFSKVFSYIGNGNEDGPFVYCGFRPKYVMIKGIDTECGWILHDTTRETYNLCDSALAYDSIGKESSPTFRIDIYSNGFKCKDTSVINYNNITYVGIAIAEQPLKWSNAR